MDGNGTVNRVNWRYLITPEVSPSMNMAVDTFLLEQVARDTVPVFRIYSWKPAAVSLGYAQKPERHIHLSRCLRSGVPVVKRPTGGKAVFHDAEVTYSICGPKTVVPFRADLMESYRCIAAGFLKFLSVLGIQGEMVPVTRRSELAGGSSCFATPSAYEISVNGKKIIGSAQKRTARAVLQHGSILVRYNHDDWKKYMRRVGDSAGRVTDLETELSRKVGFKEIADGLLMGFSQALPVEMVPWALPESVWKEIKAASERDFPDLAQSLTVSADNR